MFWFCFSLWCYNIHRLYQKDQKDSRMRLFQLRQAQSRSKQRPFEARAEDQGSEAQISGGVGYVKDQKCL